MLLSQKPMERYLVPPGPTDDYSLAEEFLCWLKRNCERYGEIYRLVAVSSG